MEKFNCDDTEIKLALEKLYEKVVAQGGWLSPEITVYESGGELSIESRLDTASNEPIIRIPEECLPKLDDFEFHIEGDEIMIQKSHSNANDLHTDIMTLMIDIYNKTRKISWHRKTNIWFVFSKSPNLLKKLFEGRKNTPKITKYYELYNSGDYDQLILNTFFGTRTLNFKSSGSISGQPSLMPFIDYFNHNKKSPGFKKRKNDHNSNDVVVVNSKPQSDSNECFVVYNKVYDAFDTYLTYGFSDLSVTYVRSVPVVIVFPNGKTLYIHSRVSQGYEGKLPPALNNLRNFIPNPVKNSKRHEVNSLIIPGEKSPLALRKVLRYICRPFLSGLSQSLQKKYILHAEETVLTENIKYYEELRIILDSAEKDIPITQASDYLNSLIGNQLDKLNNYKERLSLTY